MKVNELIQNLRFSQECFQRVLRVFVEEDSNFTPAEGMMSLAQQVAHVGHTALWFRDGALNGSFDMDFEAHAQAISGHNSLGKARDQLDQAFAQVITTVEEKSEDWLLQTLPPGPIMGDLPRYAVLLSIEEHTAHHRGSLAVYARLLGKTPPMPYMDL